MAPSSSAPTGVAIRGFTTDKQVKLFAALKKNQFHGVLQLQSKRGDDWQIYMYWGRLVYATGGRHPVRRWRRQVARFCPTVSLEAATLEATLAQHKSGMACWEYQLLKDWEAQEKITHKQSCQVILAVMMEILFDIAQISEVFYSIRPGISLSDQPVMVDMTKAISIAQKQWQVWRSLKLCRHSPNLAPVIKSAEALQSNAPEKVYSTLSKLLDGKTTVRDLSYRLNSGFTDVAKSLLPYFQMGAIGLTEIPDLPAPIAKKIDLDEAPPADRPLIACIDDSPAVCKAMNRILTRAGYQVITIQDPLRALALLLSKKPDLIFLDLVMPNTNGYEICAHLRRLPVFKTVPIVILTGNDGVVDRMRAKVVGADTFLSKPVKIATLLETVRQSLPQPSSLDETNAEVNIVESVASG
ncbi:MAG: response regulator [Cyanobacteria bacterium J06632_22]